MLRDVALILSVLFPWVLGISRQDRPMTELDAVLLLLQGCLSILMIKFFMIEFSDTYTLEF